MTRSLLTSLKVGPPPPRVVLLPDAVFFTRAISVDVAATPPEVAGAVELALETLSPFPPAQLYHGFYWVPGGARALVFAAYRRRFPSEQAAEWPDAELVVPAFACLLGGDGAPGTTLIIPSAEGLTAVYRDAQPVPARVVFRPVAADSAEEVWAQAREELAAAAPENRVIALAAAPAADTAANDGEFLFRAEGFVSRLPQARTAAMDVRDKDALTVLRSARRRDLGLWRGFLAVVAVLALLGLGELALIGSRVWQQTRVARTNQQRPVVDRIMTAQSLTTRINELSTKRLLPLEMITLAIAKKPADVTFRRTATTGLYGLTIDAYSSADSTSAFRAALAGDPAVEKVEVREQRTVDNLMNFTLVVTFKPDAVTPAAATP